jgi:hypothetical protein
MWVKKFKSLIVTRTKRLDQIVTRTKHGWTKHQGTNYKGVCRLSSKIKDEGFEADLYTKH